jgi:hypothetical protein
VSGTDAPSIQSVRLRTPIIKAACGWLTSSVLAAVIRGNRERGGDMLQMLRNLVELNDLQVDVKEMDISYEGVRDFLESPEWVALTLAFACTKLGLMDLPGGAEWRGREWKPEDFVEALEYGFRRASALGFLDMGRLFK